MDIFKEVRDLNLPLGQYIVVGSGTMEALGIRKSKDIDLVVTEDLYKEFEKKGWEKKQVSENRFGIKQGKYEMFKDFVCGNYRPDAAELINNAQIINGLPFLPLEELLKFKKELGREKDLKDIELIEEYLKQVSI